MYWIDSIADSGIVHCYSLVKYATVKRNSVPPFLFFFWGGGIPIMIMLFSRSCHLLKLIIVSQILSGPTSHVHRVRDVTIWQQYHEQSASTTMPIRIPSQIAVDCKSVHLDLSF